MKTYKKFDSLIRGFYIIIGLALFLAISSSIDSPTPLDVQQDQITDIPAAVVQKPVEIKPEPPKPKPKITDYRYVALYGSTLHRGLGSLGEQDLEATIVRAKKVAEQYQPFSEEPIKPSLEIITTVASAGPTDDGDYSQETDGGKLQAIIQRAKEEDIYVILDFQPGRDTFLDQLKQYESLLLEPHVGVGLDPEWRLLTPQARHLVTVGSVSAEELNQASSWLADLTKTHDLPQKIFMIHQFKSMMIQNRETLDTSRGELAYVIHVDGFGTLGQKRETWNKITTGLPPNTHTAWKNFYDEDLPTPTPGQTMQQTPKPLVITYQ